MGNTLDHTALKILSTKFDVWSKLTQCVPRELTTKLFGYKTIFFALSQNHAFTLCKPQKNCEWWKKLYSMIQFFF